MSVYNGCNSNNTNRMTLCRFPQAFVNRSYKLSSKNTIKLKSTNQIMLCSLFCSIVTLSLIQIQSFSLSFGFALATNWPALKYCCFLYIFLKSLACDEDEKQMIKLQQSQATAQSAPKSPCDFQPTKYEYYERLPFIIVWLQPILIAR